MTERSGPGPEEHFDTLEGGQQNYPQHVMSPPLQRDTDRLPVDAGTSQEADPQAAAPEVHEKLTMPEIPRHVPRFLQQDIQALRRHFAERRSPFEDPGTLAAVEPNPDHEYYCTPTAFLSLISAMGYLEHNYWGPDPNRSRDSLIGGIVEETARDPDRGWLRGELSHQMRSLMDHMPVISWQTGKNNDTTLNDENLPATISSHYLSTTEEIQFFRDHILNLEISEIVNAGFPVMVTVRAGFGQNTEDHTVIIDGWSEHAVHVTDPDSRNGVSLYTPEYVREYLTGACTVIPPVSDEYIRNHPAPRRILGHRPG